MCIQNLHFLAHFEIDVMRGKIQIDPQKISGQKNDFHTCRFDPEVISQSEKKTYLGF